MKTIPEIFIFFQSHTYNVIWRRKKEKREKVNKYISTYIMHMYVYLKIILNVQVCVTR